MAPKPSYEELKQKLADLQSEILERRQVETDLENELMKFRALYDLALAMHSDRSLDEYLQHIVDKCREILRSEISYIALHDEVRDDFYKHTFSGIQTEAFRNLRLPSGRGSGGLISRMRQGYIVNDYLTEQSFDRKDEQIISDEGIISGMAVSIQMGTKDLGVLYVFNRTKTAFLQRDLNTLFLIANLASVEISRRQAEELLRVSEERFRFMVETTGDVIYHLRYDTMTYDYLSPGIGKLTGYSPEEIKTIGFSSLVTRIDLPLQEDVSTKVILEDRLAGKTGEYRADYLITTKTGTSKWLRDHSFPWYDDSGKNIGSVGILSDLTDYKKAEALVRQRTAELQRSNQALQDFAFIASHDMQEPLRKVVSFGNMLQQKYKDSLEQTGNDYLNRMLDATKRMHSLLTGLLEYSRVTTNPEPFREVDVYAIIHEVLSDLEITIKQTGGEVKVGELPSIQADPTQIRQLFQNLIGNALKFHKEGERPVVDLFSTTTDDGTLQIYVKDNGIGFEEQYLDRIFAPFKRLHGRGSQYEGTGIGLAICKKIVERHGGSITAKSTTGHGATFIIALPSKQLD
ncbi:MAG: ATP-binding protein [Syntrophobacteraceae bacterium]